MSLFGVGTLDNIAEQVWFDLHEKDNSKRISGYSLDIRTENELYVVCYALIVLIKSMDGKAAVHPERQDQQLLDDAEALRDKLYQHGYINEALVDMSKVVSALTRKKKEAERQISSMEDGEKKDKAKKKMEARKQWATASAKKHAKDIADYVKSELITVGTDSTRATKIRSFIKDAMIAISQNKEAYKEDLDTLSTRFTF